MSTIKLPDNLFKYGFNGEYSQERPEAEMVERVREWIRLREVKKTKTFNPNRPSSYTFKHYAEDDLGEYVANGEMITAMILEGFEFKIDGPNARFKCSHIEQLEKVSGCLSVCKYEELRTKYNLSNKQNSIL